MISNRSAKIGADGRIRTSDHLIRSQVLYPAELRLHVGYSSERDACFMAPIEKNQVFLRILQKEIWVLA